jgi:hypothetical protein
VSKGNNGELLEKGAERHAQRWGEVIRGLVTLKLKNSLCSFCTAWPSILAFKDKLTS